MHRSSYLPAPPCRHMAWQRLRRCSGSGRERCPRRSSPLRRPPAWAQHPTLQTCWLCRACRGRRHSSSGLRRQATSSGRLCIAPGCAGEAFETCVQLCCCVARSSAAAARRVRHAFVHHLFLTTRLAGSSQAFTLTSIHKASSSATLVSLPPPQGLCTQRLLRPGQPLQLCARPAPAAPASRQPAPAERSLPLLERRALQGERGEALLV